MDVDLNVLRVRFTPARGEVYGPRDMQAKAKEADADTGHELHTLVPKATQFEPERQLGPVLVA